MATSTELRSPKGAEGPNMLKPTLSLRQPHSETQIHLGKLPFYRCSHNVSR